MTFVRIHTYSFFYLLNNTCYVYSNCITYLFDVVFNKGMTSTMTVTGLILPVLLHCGILEHPHQDFSMQNKLLKVTDRPYSHLKPPKDVHIIIWAANLPEECVKSRRPAAEAPRHPAAPRGSSLLLLWARSLRMPGYQNTQGCCLSPCAAAAAAVDLKLVKGILRHLWIQSVYGHACDFR